MSPTAAHALCPHCSADVLSAGAECWLCGKPLPAEIVENALIQEALRAPMTLGGSRDLESTNFGLIFLLLCLGAGGFTLSLKFGALFLVLVCVAVWFLLRRKPLALIPPEVEAVQALEPLRQQPEDGVVLSRVSQILRRYVVAAFDLPPGELTTTDFSRAIAGQGQVGPELSAALTEFLRQCDQRKFSPPAPAPPLSAAAQALKLIEQAQARRAALAQPINPPDGRPSASLPRAAAER